MAPVVSIKVTLKGDGKHGENWFGVGKEFNFEKTPSVLRLSTSWGFGGIYFVGVWCLWGDNNC